MTGVELAIGLGVAGMGLSAIGAISSASAQSRAAKTNAAMAERNAVIARQQAVAEEEKQRRTARRLQGQAIANVGASGITLEGSPLDVLEDSAMEQELDALTIRYNGEIGAMNYESDAALERQRSKSAMTSGYMSAGSSLLLGGSRLSGLSSGNVKAMSNVGGSAGAYNAWGGQ